MEKNREVTETSVQAIVSNDKDTHYLPNQKSCMNVKKNAIKGLQTLPFLRNFIIVLAHFYSAWWRSSCCVANYTIIFQCCFLVIPVLQITETQRENADNKIKAFLRTNNIFTLLLIESGLLSQNVSIWMLSEWLTGCLLKFQMYVFKSFQREKLAALTWIQKYFNWYLNMM